MIWELRHEYKVSLLLDVANLARATYYYHTKRRQMPDKYSEIKEQITNIFMRTVADTAIDVLLWK